MTWQKTRKKHGTKHGKKRHQKLALPFAMPLALPLAILLAMARGMASPSVPRRASCHAVFHASLPYASLLWPCHASCHASLFCHCQRRCVSRRQDLLTIERVQMLQDRKHIFVEMRAPSSTFVQWNLCVNLTRVGNTEESKLPRGSGGKKVLKAAFDSVAASASTPGLVVGDLNLKPDEVDEVIAGHPGPHNLRFIGGPGAPYPYVSCCAARQGFGMPGFAMHLAMSLAMHLAMLPRHVARCMARGMARDWQEAC